MRIFSVQNVVLLGLIMTANGSLMDRLPHGLVQLLGKGTAVAMSEKFDMNGMLEGLRAQQEQVLANLPVNMPATASQPFNFVEGGVAASNVQQMPTPASLVQANSMNPQIQAEIKQLVTEAMASGAI